MKKIKFSGRELSVMRAIDFALGTSGQELMTRTRLGAEDLTDILNAFLTVGYVETVPASEHVTQDQVALVRIEINPGYSHDLSDAIRNRWKASSTALQPANSFHSAHQKAAGSLPRPGVHRR